MRWLMLLVVLLMAAFASPSTATAVCDGYAWTIKSGQERGATNLQCAADAEKAGKLPVAMGFYWGVYADDCTTPGPMTCPGPDASQRAQARQAIVRLGRMLGVEAEKQNRLRGGDIFVLEGDDRWVVKPDAGAIGLYENSFNYAETDRVVLKLVASAPASLDLFSRAAAHFRDREQLKEPDYRANPAHLEQLRKVATTNATQALAREDGEFKKQAFLGDTSHFERSLAELKSALAWHAAVQLTPQKVLERATQRGDSLMKGTPAPRLIQQALQYYELAGDGARSAQAKTVATRLGDDAARKGELDQARHYFQLAGDERRVQELSGLSEKRKEQVEREMRKDKRQQDEFKEGQKKLEKELGL